MPKIRETIAAVRYKIRGPYLPGARELALGNQIITRLVETKKPVVLIVAHNDDEISAGGLIQTYHKKGSPFHQVMVVNKPGDEIRRAELHEAAQVLGTREDQITFLDIAEEGRLDPPSRLLTKLVGEGRALSYQALDIGAKALAFKQTIEESLRIFLEESEFVQPLLIAPISGIGIHQSHTAVRNAVTEVGQELGLEVAYLGDLLYRHNGWGADTKFQRDHELTPVYSNLEAGAGYRALLKYQSQLAELFPRGVPDQLAAEEYHFRSQFLASIVKMAIPLD